MISEKGKVEAHHKQFLESFLDNFGIECNVKDV